MYVANRREVSQSCWNTQQGSLPQQGLEFCPTLIYWAKPLLFLKGRDEPVQPRMPLGLGTWNLRQFKDWERGKMLLLGALTAPVPLLSFGLLLILHQCKLEWGHFISWYEVYFLIFFFQFNILTPHSLLPPPTLRYSYGSSLFYTLLPWDCFLVSCAHLTLLGLPPKFFQI